MSSKRFVAWCIVQGLVVVACSAPSSSPSGAAPTGEAPLSADQDGLRGKLAGCFGLAFDTAMGWLVPEKVGGILETQRACLVEAATCDDVQECFGVEAGSCPEVAECDGDVATHCWLLHERAPVLERQDCAQDRDGNHTCFITNGHGPDEAYAQCGAGSCQVDSCDDDVLVQCINGVAVRSNCARAGKRCVQTSGIAFCAVDEACTESRCEGDTVVSCDFGYVVFRQACSEVLPEATCVEEHGAVSCRAPQTAAACDADNSPPEVCVGDLARHCSQGIWVDVDCAAVGSTCVEQAIDQVACSPPPDLH